MVAKCYGDLTFYAAVEMKFRAKGYGILTSTAVCLWWYKARRQNEMRHPTEGNQSVTYLLFILLVFCFCYYVNYYIVDIHGIVAELISLMVHYINPSPKAKKQSHNVSFLAAAKPEVNQFNCRRTIEAS